MEATGFGVMHVDDDDRIVSFLEKPKDPPGMPGNPDMALASMGIYVFETKFLFDQLRRDAADPNSSHDFGKDIIPHIVKNGKAWRTASRKSCVRSAARDRGLLARRRHGRRLLGGQYRPHRHRAGARSLRPRLADLDLCRAHAAGQVRPRRGRPARHGGQLAGLRRLHRLGRRLRRSLLFTGVRVNSYASLDEAVVLPYVEIGRGARLSKVVDRPRRATSRRAWWSARTRSSTPSASGAPRTASA